jgi:small-conductance mechanosensitive channel
MLDYLIDNPWLLALLWAGMYVFDYQSTLWLAKSYRKTFSRYVLYEHGVELNPNFEKEIAAAVSAASRGITLSRKFILLLLLVVVILLLSPVVARAFTEFLAGALLLTWSFINARHLRNYAYAWFLKRKPEALKGRQEQSYWFMQKMLAAEAFVFAVLYLFLAVMTLRPFFLAGTITCLAVCLRAYRLANRKFEAPKIANG